MLTQARQIPVGSILDTRSGTVRLTTATASRARLAVTDFSAGVFTASQPRKQRGQTEVRLIDALSARAVCAGAGKAQTARKHLSKQVLGLLRSKGRRNDRYDVARGKLGRGRPRGTNFEHRRPLRRDAHAGDARGRRRP